MAMKMYKGQDSEIVNSRDVRARLNDGWTFNPSVEPQAVVKPHWRQRRRMKISKADASVNNKQSDLFGPEDSNNTGA
tara:strand:+ start:1818 stop:2048 length:231 start_codon:yes stop_codon:yes gene_type:complete